MITTNLSNDLFNSDSTPVRTGRRAACLLAVVSFGVLASCGGSSDSSDNDRDNDRDRDRDTTEVETTESDVETTEAETTDVEATDVEVTDVETTDATDVATTVEEAEVDAFELLVGDCIADPTEDQVTEVTVVDCAQPHDNELFHAFDIEGDEYPGDEEIAATSEETCLAEFEPFIGAPYAESIWDVTYLSPSQGSWEDGGDREVLCAVFLVSGEQATGSAAGAAE